MQFSGPDISNMQAAAQGGFGALNQGQVRQTVLGDLYGKVTQAITFAHNVHSELMEFAHRIGVSPPISPGHPVAAKDAPVPAVTYALHDGADKLNSLLNDIEQVVAALRDHA